MEMLSEIMKNVDMIVAVYDATKSESFGNVTKVTLNLSWLGSKYRQIIRVAIIFQIYVTSFFSTSYYVTSD